MLIFREKLQILNKDNSYQDVCNWIFQIELEKGDENKYKEY